MIRALVIASLIARAVPAWAQAASPVTADAPVFEPPRAHSVDVPYPAGAPPHTEPVAVTVKLTIDATGAVTRVDQVGPPQPVFDEAVLAAARSFRFDPATSGGRPVAVELTFTHTFLPPPPSPPADDGPARSAVLRGSLIELGTRVRVSGATVTAVAEREGGGERSYTVDTDDQGRFALALPAGSARITVTSAAHRRFLQREQLVVGQELSVTYLVERDRYDPYEIVVVGDQRREEVARIALRGPELTQVPGTFGDPFRVIQALPGVATIASLLPFPVVRGSAPAATSIALDGTRIPLLYHLGAGPSVIHPELVDQIDFYPGGAPAGYGGYVGGIVDGQTRRARAGERLVDLDVNLLQAGGIVRTPIPGLGATATVAGRYGYPGLVISQVTDEASISYWDYQARIDGGTPASGWTVFAFGARDQADERRAVAGPDPMPTDPAVPPPPAMTALEPALILGFHRLDLRGHTTAGALRASARLVLGFDETLFDDGDGASRFWSWNLEPEVQLAWRPATGLRVLVGLEGAVRRRSARLPDAGAMPSELVFGDVVRGLGPSYLGAAYLDVVWRPSEDWLVRPGVRAELHGDRTARHAALDPRLTVRYRLARRELDEVAPDSDASSIWLKASAGIYHQPARYLVPVPGLDQLALSHGLQRAVQASLGVEAPLDDGFELTAEGYYNHLDPNFFELTVPDDDIVPAPYPVLLPDHRLPATREPPVLDQFAVRAPGRAYGVEAMIRRRSSTGVHGWASYTLSRSERRRDGRWQPYDFDRTHLVNLVAGIPLGRNWDLGLRMQFQTGKPQPVLGESMPRNAPYARFDIRFDKHVAWRDWIFDFYVDITNAAVMPEEFRAGDVLRYVLPTAGVRGRL